MSLTVKLNVADNVAVARTQIEKGMLIPELAGVEAKNSVPRFHKIATTAIAQGSPIIKYDQSIGVALTDIAAGEHVHVHNCGMPAGGVLERRVAQSAVAEPKVWNGEKQFMGFHRDNGQVGTRNYIGIITTVNCSASVAKALEHYFSDSSIASQYPNVDGVVSFAHSTGCGMGKGEGFDILQRVYEGFAAHPNFAAVLMIGLGCEVMQVREVIKRAGRDVNNTLVPLVIQEQGGTRKTIEAGKTVVYQMLEAANQLHRAPAPLSALKVGLQCGGSDALSGITANPSLGAAMDYLVTQGGTAILSETPEIFGAEHLLIARAKTPQIAEKLQARIKWWLDYTEKHGVELNNNPSPGNKAGGLTTILEKSLGAQAKGGTSTLFDVYEYAQPVTSSGLVVMDSPGYDPVSVTGQMASGANVICFTTGRGSVFGAMPVPSLKLATNTPLYESMQDDMDINCGTVFDGLMSVDTCGQQVLQQIIATASGEKTKSEGLGYGRHEFLPWHMGAVI